MSIRIENLSHLYNKKTEIENLAIKNIDLSLNEKPFFVALVGETGSGKSTLVQHINGLLKPTEGKIIVDDFTLSAVKKENSKKIVNLRKKVGYLFQFSENQIFESTVLKDVSFGPSNFGFSKDESLKKAKESLEIIGLNESYYERSPFELSGGEKRRVAIAGVLAYGPKYLVLDEPTAGLDSKGKKNLEDLLINLHKNGISIILVTHDMNVVLKCCEKVIHMEKGRIVSYTTTAEFFKDKSIEEHSIKKPKLLDFCDKISNKYNISNVRTIDDLIERIKNG